MQSFKLAVEENWETRLLELPIPDEMLRKLGWKDGDEIVGVYYESGKLTLQKKNQTKTKIDVPINPEEINGWLTDTLSKDICEVTYIDTLNNNRYCKCTLKTDELTDVALKKKKMLQKLPPNKIYVWDLEKLLWRTFEVLRVTGVKKFIGP